MNLKCKIKGVEYPLIQGVTFSEEYNETLDSATIMISQIPQIKDLKPYDGVFIYDKDFNGFAYKGTMDLNIIKFNDYSFENPYYYDFTDYDVIDTNISVYDIKNGEIIKNLRLDMSGSFPILKNESGNIIIECEYDYNADTKKDYINFAYSDTYTILEEESFYTIKYNKQTTSTNTFYKHLLVDQFSETIINLSEGLYKYKIELFSETKGLETIQLPNISITQSRDIKKRKSVYDYIKQFTQLYSPKLKYSNDNGATFVYASKYTIDEDVLFNTFKDTYAPDFSLNNPNLRDVLTQLMLTKDMIPYVEDNVIKALDITKRNDKFNDNKEYVNYINGSRSSSNHCDNLRRSYVNALSQDNTCKMVEYLGFRNNENALLTLDNMRLETRFPIYKINKIYMCYYKKGQIIVPASETKVDTRSVVIRSGDQISYTIYGIQGTITNLSATCDNPRIDVVATHTFYINESNVTVNYSTTSSEERGNITLVCTYKPNNYTPTPREKMFLCKQDITPLVMLNSERALIKEDWNNFGKNIPNSVEEMAKYKLCTVGYNIGDNKIEGWGKKYSYPQGWWSVNNTYVENILYCLDRLYPYGTYQYGFLTNNIGGLKPNETFKVISETDVKQNMYNPFTNSSLALKGLFFQVEYNAFYNGCVVHSKDEGNDLITINDNSSNSLTLLEQDGLFQKEKINRFGNKAITINARYPDTSYLQKLGSVYGDDYVIYHREYNVYNNVVNAVYYATKDYVLKNYYTSVYAKHRPYNLMSYGESVNRSENKKVIAYLTDTPMYEDKDLPFDIKSGLLNEIFSFATPSETPASIDTFIDTHTINCGLIDRMYLSDVNGFVSGNSLCFNLRMYDNVSGGVYIKDKEPKVNLVDPTKDFTGSVQDWYIDVDDVETGFKKNMDFELFHFDKSKIFKDNILIEDTFQVYETYNNVLFKLPYLQIYENQKSNIIKGNYNLYKDNKETIDMTFQIEPISKNRDRVVFSQWLMKLSNLLGSYHKVDEEINVVDLFGFENAQKIAYATFKAPSTLTTAYMPLMLVVFDKDVFNSLEKGPNTQYASSGQFVYDVDLSKVNNAGSDTQAFYYSFSMNSIDALTETDLYIAGKQEIVTKTGKYGKDVTPFISNNSYHLKKITNLGSKAIPDRYVVFANGNIVDYQFEQDFIWAYEDSKIYYHNKNNEKIYLTKYNCRFGAMTDKFIYYGNENSESFKTDTLGITFKEKEEKKYFKNMFIVLDSKPIKKEIVYNEYVDLPNKSNTLKVSDIIKVVNGKIKVDLTNVPNDTQSIQYWFLDNIKYSRTKQNNTEVGIWNSDFSKTSYKFVFGVNLTQNDFAKGFAEISINALNNRDFRVFDVNNNLIKELN